MTENECIDVLKNLAFLSGKKEHEKCEKAIEMAIHALSEIQQYRAIGTVEEIRFMKSACEMNDEVLNSLANAVREKMKYEAIGTIEELQALKENSFFNFVSPVVSIDEKSYNKAIDDFINKLLNWKSKDEEYKSLSEVCYEIAKELKGVRNEG